MNVSVELDIPFTLKINKLQTTKTRTYFWIENSHGQILLFDFWFGDTASFQHQIAASYGAACLTSVYCVMGFQLVNAWVQQGERWWWWCSCCFFSYPMWWQRYTSLCTFVATKKWQSGQPSSNVRFRWNQWTNNIWMLYAHRTCRLLINASGKLKTGEQTTASSKLKTYWE